MRTRHKPRIRGWVWARKNGILVAQGPNLIVSVGLNSIAQLIGVGTFDIPTDIAIGDSANAPLLSQTGLQGTQLDKQAATASVVDNVVTFTATLGAGIGSSVSVREAALLGPVPSVLMWARWLTGGIPMDAGNSLQIDWALTVE